MSNLPTLLPSIPRVTDPTNQYMDDTGIEADAMHNLIASELEALAVMVGVTGSAVTSTLDHKVRVDLPASIAAAQAAAIAGAPVQSVAGRTGAVTLSTSDVGLGNCDNTSDANKPVSTAQAAAIAAAQAAAIAGAPVQSVAGRTGAVTLSTSDVSGFTSAAASAAPVQSVAGRTGAVTIASGDVSGFNAAALAAAPAETTTTIGSLIAGAAQKTIISPSDKIALSDSESSGIIKWVSTADILQALYLLGMPLTIFQSAICSAESTIAVLPEVTTTT